MQSTLLYTQQHVFYFYHINHPFKILLFINYQTLCYTYCRQIEETSLTELEEAKKQLLAQLNDTTPICGTPENRVGKVKTIDLGTPLLKSVSPYAKLPSADKFSINICDVINFENLPDSTGKYEKMSGIIRKVRDKLSKISDDT
jgi:hypothetical protein